MALKSSSNTSILPSCLSETNTTSHRDASFSSYLNNTEENYIHSLVKTTQSLKYHHTNSKPKKVVEDEIDVFSADKYFNGVIHQESNTVPAIYKEQVTKNQTNKAMISLSKLKFQPRTPSIHSESSWNSQSALLRPALRNLSKNESIRGKKSLFLSCYCCDTKSVDIESNAEYMNQGNSSFNNAYNRGITRTIKTSFDTAEITRLNKLRLDSSDPFIEMPVSEPLTAMKKIHLDVEDEEERRRKTSLEVFGSRNDEESKRLNMLAWDAIPRPVEEIDTSGPPTGTYEDTDSDASSDLFEIECLSCTANPVGLGGLRNGSVGSASPTTGYAPSEASVDWSVVTASAADFSDHDSTITSVTRSKMGPKSRLSAKMASNRGMLSGCKSQKAVMVADDVYRSSDKRKSGDSTRIRHRFSDSYTSVSRFQVEAKLPGHGISQSKRISGSDLLKHL